MSNKKRGFGKKRVTGRKRKPKKESELIEWSYSTPTLNFKKDETRVRQSAAYLKVGELVGEVSTSLASMDKASRLAFIIKSYYFRYLLRKLNKLERSITT